MDYRYRELSKIIITNESGDWIWRGKLNALQVFGLAKLADKFSDDNEEHNTKASFSGLDENETPKNTGCKICSDPTISHREVGGECPNIIGWLQEEYLKH